VPTDSPLSGFLSDNSAFVEDEPKARGVKNFQAKIDQVELRIVI